MTRSPADPLWTPLAFLAALGAGGTVVTFFLWLMFWVPHPGRPVPVFEDIIAAFAAGGPLAQAMILAAWAGIALFSALHVMLLIRNLRAWATWRHGVEAIRLRASPGEVQLLALPLTLAMSVNAGFILGLVFVPGLWGVVETLFPAALAAFLAIGIWALRLTGGFYARILTRGGLDGTRTNSFAQMLPAFALAMVAVGLAAPAAMSTTPAVAGISHIASTVFLVASVVIAAVMLVLGTRAMFEHGADAESAPTLLVLVPILTVLAIALMRQGHGLHAHFGLHGSPADSFVMLTRMAALQLLVGLLGLSVLRRQGYVRRFVTGAEHSNGAWALVCPAVAAAVMVQFWVNKGLVGAGLVTKFSATYWALSLPAVAFQILAIWLILRLGAKGLGRPAPRSMVPAE